jgi:hypothetical protein
MVRENRRITVDDIAEALNISHGPAYYNLHDTPNWCGAKLIKDATKKLFFSDGINLRNAVTGTLKSSGITLKNKY